VGKDPVDLILSARAEGKFKDLNDFIRRVDLHRVGKRSLECMIRVGALDCFGPRKALLAVMDSMISISNSHFKAASSGQLSIFGEASGIVDDIHLPEGMMLDRREQLEWEKELIGLYVSDHPITPYLPYIRLNASHSSIELAEVAHQTKVTVAGLVTRMRTLTTKNGNPMAFATVEDLQGPIELVIFPKVWERFSLLVQMETVIIADGKIDSASGDPKILVDTIRAIQLEDVTDEMRKAEELALNTAVETSSSEPEIVPMEMTVDSQMPEEPEMPMLPDDWHLAPPPDVNKPFELKAPPIESKPMIAAPPVSITAANKTQAAAVQVDPVKKVELKQAPIESKIAPEKGDAVSIVDQKDKLQAIAPPEFSDPYRSANKSKKQLITVTLTASGEKERDVRRMRRVHGLLNSFPGDDRYCFLIFEQGRKHLLDFPNDTTAANTELLNKLVELVGPENVQVEIV
jgi:DNA polymerase-3 subunit alpha